jgi:basic membrane protein A
LTRYWARDSVRATGTWEGISRRKDMKGLAWRGRYRLRRILALGIVLWLGSFGLGGWSTIAAADGSPGESDNEGEFSVGLVTDAAGLNDNGFNHLAFIGLTKAEDELDIRASVTESKSFADYVPNLTNYAAQQFDLVIAVGFTMGPAVGTVSGEFPNTHFAILDGLPTDLNGNPLNRPNVESVFFKEQESGALVGVVAGMLETTNRAPKNQNVIGAVGGLSFVPGVQHYIAGYKWGAKLVDPSVNVLIDYSNDFSSPPACAALADTQISKGADIIFPVAGGCGVGALHAAGLAHVYSIGVDLSQKSVDASVIVSALKRFDMATFDVIKAADDGEFQSGVVKLGLNDDATGYSVDNFPGGELPADIGKEVARVEQQIASGVLTPPEDPAAVI